MNKWSILFFVVQSCALPVDVGSNRSEQIVQGTGQCQLSGPKEQVIPLTLKQAECAGLTARLCSACHQPKAKDCFELYPNPLDVPLHPEGITTLNPASCGIDSSRRDAGVACRLTGPASEVIPLSFSQAECAGLTSNLCAACHRPTGETCWELRPRGVPPPPPSLPPVPASCGIPGFGDAGR